MFGLFLFDNWFLNLVGTVFRFHLRILKPCSLRDLLFLNVFVFYQPILWPTATGNLILKAKELSIDWDNLLFPIQTMAKEVRAVHARLEPVKNKANKRDMGEIYSKNPILLAWQDAFRTYDWRRAFSDPEATKHQISGLLQLVWFFIQHGKKESQTF